MTKREGKHTFCLVAVDLCNVSIIVGFVQIVPDGFKSPAVAAPRGVAFRIPAQDRIARVSEKVGEETQRTKGEEGDDDSQLDEPASV